jgi:O-antigen ligase
MLNRPDPRRASAVIFYLLPFTLLALALALLPLPLAAGLVVGAAALLLAISDPIWAVGAVALALPIQDLAQLPGGVSFTWAAVALLAGSLGLHTLSRPEQPLRPGRLGLALAGLVWALGLATALTPYSQSEGLKETARWASALLVYVAVVASFDAAPSPAGRRWRALVLVGCLLLGPAGSALVGLRQFVSADGPPSFQIAGGQFVRAYGTIGQPNSFAGYMNMAWPLAAGLALWAVGGFWARRSRPLASAVLLAALGLGGLVGGALAASFSRGGWLGAAGGGAMVLISSALLLPPRPRRAAIQLIGGAAVVGGLALVLGAGGLLPEALGQRLGSITRNLRLFDVRTVAVTPENFAVVERMAHMQAGWRMLARHPLTGVGPGSYTLAYEATAGPGERPIALHPWYASRGHAHNYYLHIAAEAGLIGLAAYGLLLSLLALTAARALRAAQGWLWRGLAVGASGVVAAVAAHNLFENLHVLNLGLQLGAIWGLLVCVERYGAEKRDPL